MQPSSRHNTKLALIRAAERLFAEKGLGAVSVKDITSAAGARNPSAVHYHFGNMEALIKEIFSERFQQIERDRLDRFEKLDLSKQDNPIAALMEAAMAPFMEACLEEEGRLYVRFSIQLMADPRFQVNELVGELGMKSVTELRRRLADHLTAIPPHVLATRLRQAFMISMIQASDYAQRVEAGKAVPINEAVREAAAGLSGFLSAEVS